MNLSQVILGHVVTEKSMNTVDKYGHHSLFIHADATKIDVKSAVKKFFGTKVLGVSIIKLPIKIRVRSKHGPQVKRKVRKKAILRLARGETLDILKLTPATKPKEKAVKKEAVTLDQSKTSVQE